MIQSFFPKACLRRPLDDSLFSMWEVHLHVFERRGLVGPAIMNKPRDIMVKNLDEVPGLTGKASGPANDGEDDHADA